MLGFWLFSNVNKEYVGRVSLSEILKTLRKPFKKVHILVYEIGLK
jgi:hypothetical protein